MTLLEKLNNMEVKEQLLYEPFSRKQWLEQREEDRKNAFNMANATAERIATDQKELMDVLAAMARFPQYSAGNVLLIHAQRADATFIKDYKTWKDMGAHIKENEKGISIFEVAGEYVRNDGTVGTRYNLKKVFDISQVNDVRIKNAETKKDYGRLLEALISSSPCVVKTDRTIDTGYLKAEYDDYRKEINISSTGSYAELFKETSSAILMAEFARENRNNFSMSDWKFASQCGSYVLCKRYGVAYDNDSFEAPPEAFTKYEIRKVKEFLGQVRYASALISQGMDKELLKDLYKDEPEQEAI